MNELETVEILQLFNIIEEYKNGNEDCKEEVIDILKRAKHYLNKMKSNNKRISFMNDFLMFRDEYLMKIMTLNESYIDTEHFINIDLSFLSDAIAKTRNILKQDLRNKYYDNTDVVLAIVLELMDMFNYLEIYFNYIRTLESSMYHRYEIYNLDFKREEVNELMNSIESKIKLLEKKDV